MDRPFTRLEGTEAASLLKVFFSTTSLNRVHAEYQLNEEPNFPFWFTPALFSGRLVIDIEAKHIEHFELALPTNKQLNIGK